MRRTMLGLAGAALLAASGAAGASASICLGSADVLAAFARTKAQGFAIDNAATRQSRALQLIDCLGDPDPEVRDGLAYEALQTWMRADALDEATRRTLLQRLSSMLAAGADDGSDGRRASFAALVLSEVARTDRIAAWMTPEERVALVEAAAVYLQTLRDYRGFDPRDGWRHGVAHAADLLMQLALDPGVQAPQLERIVAAIATQMPPHAAHFYIYGEPQRLARPLLFVAQRGVFDEAQWTAWIAARIAPLTADASPAWRDQAWLAQRHALLAFLQALYVETDASDDARLAPLRAAVLTALKSMP